ncbi:hypothetical protein FQA39_LY04071 [Lamprigera yunnana]|nr:hypothetical protein FQA39_LY04071 [Lamprigera yunnana]
MPDDRKKVYSKQSTGTVPKIKHRNNRTIVNHDNFQRNLSNNLGSDWQRQEYSNYSRNSERNLYNLPYTMESSFTDRRQNPPSQLNLSTNGTLSTSSTSGSNSRRDSIGMIPKCDNVKKCPDKRQLEDKLNQIREYLRVTTSLMTSIKNDDQENHNMDVAVTEHMQKFSQLLDILACKQDKFNNICNTNNGVRVFPLENGMDNVTDGSGAGYQRNELEEKVELTNRKVERLRQQQNALINLKRKAENQLHDARQAQENLLIMQQQQQQQQQQKNENRPRNSDLESEHVNNEMINDKNLSENQFDLVIKELSDRLDSMRNDSRRTTINTQDNNLDFLHDQLNINNQLLQLLDNKDSQLSGEHMDLQQKLNDLQGKKMQIDQLTEQLQNLGDEDDEDIGSQVRKIVTMKQQLSSLKDLLEVVKNTEVSLLDSQNVNDAESESQTIGHSGTSKTDNIRQNVLMNCNQNDGARLENNPARINEQWCAEKQSNKSIKNIKERERVLAELKAKKRELEEIMYKQKDSTSINNDVCSETSMNKSDLGPNNVFDNVAMSWLPVQPYQHNQVTSAYSSDECPEEDANEYSELNSSADATIGTVPQPQLVVTSNYPISTKRPDLNQSFDGSRLRRFGLQSTSRLSEPSIPTVSTVTPTLDQEQPLPSYNTNGDTKGQLQKQLELIQCVCQSLLDQQGSNATNVQHLRNNLTPSSMYAEPRAAYAPMNHRPNTNTSPLDMSYMNNPHPCFGFGDVGNNQNMLAANTLQTQAFLLNTLNQCCQMLWFQQREIASLRAMICSMQDQMMNGQPELEMNSIQMAPNTYSFPTRPMSSLSNFRAATQSRNSNPKVNHIPAACSVPHMKPIPIPVNTDPAYLNQNNVRTSPTARLLETTSMHSQLNLSGDSPANNTALHSVNINTGIVQPVPWNRQALNNQVAPGNRANNYWDNFRSYSRQNLLSTTSKSNEVLQHPTSFATVIERSNSAQSTSVHPFTPPKLNLVYNESVNTSEEGIPQRSQNINSTNKPIATIPPDVLNINHHSNQKRNELHPPANIIRIDLNLPENNLVSDRNEPVGDVRNVKDSGSSPGRNRNEWHDNEQSDNLPKSKLFEELRENVYKEVANLISANENRPHFLIQLFRDLQHINSDSLRSRTLQSIQTVLTNSLSLLENSRGANRQPTTQIDQENVQANFEDFSVLQTLWSASPVTISQNSSNIELENNEDPDIHNILKAVFSFLKNHHEEVFQSELIDLLKDLIIKAMPFTQMFANTNLQERTFHKHFLSILSEAFEKYQGRRIGEVKQDLLKTISDILINEFSFIYLVQENIPDNCENIMTQCNNSIINDNQLSLNLPAQSMIQIAEEGNTPQMQNEDLAEADQSCIEILDEEGAVGGVINGSVEGAPSAELTEVNAIDSTPDYTANSEVEEFGEQGLDQVPTRLTTSLRTVKNPSSRERANTPRTDHSDHF